MKKIAINGFGRIGRLVFRHIAKSKTMQVVAINDLTDPKTLAHLLKYDTAHHQFDGVINHDEKSIMVNNRKIPIFAERDPENLPWKELGIDCVVESTGFFLTSELANKHIKAGAEKVLISAPAKSPEIKTIVYSVNEKTLTSEDKIVSAASCTTNALGPMVDALNKEFGIEYGYMTTIHAYTGDQKLQDGPHRDLRRARAGASNMVPTTTGAAAAIGKVIPELNKKLDGFAIRVPVITGSIVDLSVKLKKTPTISEINAAMRKYKSPSFAYYEDPIVSSDIIGATAGSLFDSLLTSKITVKDETLFKTITWYDNENSYVSQYVRVLQHFITL